MTPTPCPACGQPASPGKRHCGHCGAVLPARCPTCGAVNPPQMRFCEDCGTALTAPGGPSPAGSLAPSAPLVLETHFTTFQRSLPSAVHTKIFTEPEGENRVLTILFADLTGSVQRTAGLHPEDAAALVDGVLKAMVDAILKYEGRINRLLGDAVLAFFGTPQAHENDPERAILAALELRDAVQKLGLNVTTGINMGEVYLGAIGAQQHHEITAQGPVVNLAARLREKAQPGQILVGETIYRHTRRAFAFTRQEVRAKGFVEPIAAYEVVRPLPRPEKVRGIEGLHASLIGRDHELEQLKQALSEVRAGRGQIACLIGEAGVGKSRLIAELQEVALTPQQEQSLPLWLEGRCLDVGMTVSYWPFLDMLRAYCSLAPEDDERARGERITASLQALAVQGSLTAARCEEMLPLLGNLLSARFGSTLDERLTHAGPEQIKHQTFLALRDLFVTFAQQQPVVLILEDLHWADSLSLDVISLLMETLTLAPLFLVCVYRPEREHKCWHLAAIATRKCHERFTELYLKELTAQQSRRLVESLLHIEALPAPVKEQILSKTQGNPFFVEEVVRSLIDADLVYHDGQVWRAREEISELAVPESVQSVILSRVDRLDGEVKHVLQSAAVIGRLFQRRLLGQVTQREEELDGALQELEDRQLIYEERAIPEEEYSFEHVLTQETVYGNILRRRRAVFHQQVAEGIERLYAESLESYYEQLAHHYDQAGAVEQAVVYLLKAGEKARRAFLNQEALTFFQRALALLEDSPTGETHKEQQLEALRGLGLTHNSGLGDMARAEECFRQAIALGSEVGLATRDLVRLWCWLAETLFWQARYQENLAVIGQAQNLIDGGVSDGVSVEAVMVNTALAMTYYVLRRTDEAHLCNARIARMLPHLPYFEERRDVFTPLMLDALQEKDVERARTWAGDLASLAREHHDTVAQATAQALLANVLWRTGDLAGAVEGLKASAELHEKNDLNAAALMRIQAAETCLNRGDLRGAEEHVARGTALLAGTSPRLRHAMLALRGTVALCRGEVAAARGHVARAADLWEAAALGHGGSDLYLGRMALAEGHRALALQRFKEALEPALDHVTPGSYDVALVPNVLSGIEEASGDSEQVRKAVSRLHAALPTIRLLPILPALEPAEAAPRVWSGVHLEAGRWDDPFGDCSCTRDGGLLLRAANGRDLWQVNLSAPRLLQPAPSGNIAAQAVCTPFSDEQPAIGGLLLWQNARDYLVLERGRWGAADIAFRGCVDNNDLYLGRGRLLSEHTWLRLERRGEQVRALCSADGKEWFTAGAVEFPHREGEQIGVQAIGMIDRTIYHGAFAEGTAILFESFAMWTAGAD